MIRRGSKHERTDSYLHLARQLSKCMTRADTLNWQDYGGYTEITAPSSIFCSMEKDDSKRVILNNNLSQSCSANEDVSKQSFVKKPYRKTILRTWKNYVLGRKINQNAQLRNKNDA